MKKDVWALQSDKLGGLLKKIKVNFIPEAEIPSVSIDTTGKVEDALVFGTIGEAMKFISNFSEQARLYGLSTSLEQILSFKVMRF